MTLELWVRVCLKGFQVQLEIEITGLEPSQTWPPGLIPLVTLLFPFHLSAPFLSLFSVTVLCDLQKAASNMLFCDSQLDYSPCSVWCSLCSLCGTSMPDFSIWTYRQVKFIKIFFAFCFCVFYFPNQCGVFLWKRSMVYFFGQNFTSIFILLEAAVGTPQIISANWLTSAKLTFSSRLLWC